MIRSKLCALLAAALVAAGCGSTIPGNPVPEGAGGSEGSFETGQFDKVLTECNVVTPEEIAEAVGGTEIDQNFLGAICRFDVNGAAGFTKVTFNWFEWGSMKVEAAQHQKLNYTLTDITVQGRKAFLAQPPKDPNSCGVTFGAPSRGIIGWWVQYRPDAAHPDPCKSAQTLAELTLNLAR